MISRDVARRLVYFTLALVVLLAVDFVLFDYFFAFQSDQNLADVGPKQDHYVLFGGPVFTFIGYSVSYGWRIAARSHDSIVAVFLVGLFFVTALLTHYCYRMWAEARILRIRADALAAKQGLDLDKAIRIAQQSADAATRTVVMMERSSAMQLRAYAMIKEVVLDQAPDVDGLPGLVVRFTVMNFGRTPARQVAYWLAFKIRPVNTADHLDMTEPAHGQRFAVLAPGDSLQFRCPLPTLEDVVSIVDGRNALYVYGQIQYHDGFDKSRTSNFNFMRCGPRWAEPGAFVVCRDGNDAT